ncbi:hypothetical protein OSG_eHP25_00110 [environmental Halophage eHP-25]|nr:hypothetical protein OSG_eHP25_00110 [environmental Halophage eHP-25]
MYKHVFELEDTFDFEGVAKDWSSGNYTIEEISEKYDISRDIFFAIKREAPHNWIKGSPCFWWTNLNEADDDLSQKAKESQKANRVKGDTKNKISREESKAANQWWNLEDTIGELTNSWDEESYEPPSATVTIATQSLEKGAILLNCQDWHIGKRDKDSNVSLGEYIQNLKDAFADGIERAKRLKDIEALYLVTGGDLIHVDGPHGTTKQTPQDLVCSPGQAFKEAVELLVWCIDYARSLNIETHVLTIMGNHDRTLSSAAGVALQQRFINSKNVITDYPLQERIYTTYNEHLIMATHGDMKKKHWRNLPSIMMDEARNKLSTTTWQMVVTGHLHFQSVDVEDRSGTIYAQGSSPSPDDQWHYQNGLSSSRKGIQMIILEPDSPSTSIIQQSV